LLALIDTGLVPGPMLFAFIGLCVGMAWTGRDAIPWPILRVALGGLVLGTAVGAGILMMLPASSLGKVFAVVILAAIVLSLSGLRVRADRLSCLLGGIVSGVMGTMSGIHGPPIGLVLQHEEPQRMRAMMGTLFALGYCFSVAALWIVGLFGWTGVGLGVAMIPGTLAGFAVAPWLARAIDRRRLRIAILTISAVSAVLLFLH
jgi:uncharacterized protein